MIDNEGEVAMHWHTSQKKYKHDTNVIISEVYTVVCLCVRVSGYGCVCMSYPMSSH